MKSREEIIAFARESLGVAPGIEAELIPFEGRGSDRTYYRFQWDSGHSTILVNYDPSRVENTYYADIALFLLQNKSAVPEILRHDAAECIILMRDLGDTDLWCLRNESWEVRRSLYQKTLKVVHKLHSFPEARFPSGQVKLTDAFGLELYRWERDYFRENFVTGFCAVHLGDNLWNPLEEELARLAQKLSTLPRTLVHRDLQSQNVMIYEDKPFLIDFQGMRFGTRFYDLGSILCDPYVDMSISEREELLQFYYEIPEQDLDWQEFQKSFWEASAQRLMQALGAYGFLGIKKGLRNYLVHIPAAIRNLRTAAENAASLPILLKVCKECEEALTNARSYS